MSKARVVWVNQDVFDARIGRAQSVKNYNFIGGYPFVEQSAYTELERKLTESQKACDEFAKKFAQYHDAFIKQQTVIEKLKELGVSERDRNDSKRFRK